MDGTTDANRMDEMTPMALGMHARSELEELRALVGRGRLRCPELATRLERAASIVVLRAIRPLADGSHLVESEREPGRFYHVHRHCTCVDSRHAPGGWCKHRLAVGLLTALGRDPQCDSATAQTMLEANSRLAVLEAAVVFTARRTWLSSTDLMRLAQRWESWILEEPQRRRS